ncbi:MAG: prolyl oligopeptidase family serine peptidase [Thermoguttaceae bacterium]
MKRAMLFLLALALILPAAFGQARYQKPPKEILDVLNAPPPPAAFLSPTHDTIVFAKPLRYPPISDLAAPMLRLAGIRIDPRTNAERSYPEYFLGLTLKKLPGGAETPIALPAQVRIGYPRWNANGTMFAFTNETTDRVELWVADVPTGKARPLSELRINPLLGDSVEWMPDQKTLLVKLLPGERGAPPERPFFPPGPKTQESAGARVASSTYEARDVLKSPYDADLFDYYATSQLALVDAVSRKVTRIGKPAILGHVDAAPGGRYLLVERIHRPYSYLCAYERFPKDIEVWTTGGELVETLASLPLTDQVPINGVPTGPRDHVWRCTEPATLVWAEALDGGDPKTKAPHRDRVLLKPVEGTTTELCKTEQRFTGLRSIETGGLVLVSEFDRDRLRRRTFIMDADDPAKPARLLWDMSANEKYRHPGYPIYRVLPTGSSAVMRHNDCIYLVGMGASSEGDRPFIDQLNLNTLKTQRLFRSDRSSYEFYVDGFDPVKGTFITRRESPADPPNFFIRTLAKRPLREVPEGEASWTSTSQALTQFPDPAPQLRGITKRLITYARADGVPLSSTLYLPPGYRPGTRLPTVVYAYPLDYAEKEVAGQIAGSSQRFTTIGGASELFFLLEGYAVLDNAAMPVVGPPETAYDTFVEQIVANAKAAIDKAVELGVTDPRRVGVMGHSHGALMTANLLAHSNLFRAGIARSGAYNHTLRPFGFQNEHRTFWQARDVYLKLSPVLQADKINKPLLLIHGELDQNPGTVPLQSEKLFEAVRGIGGTVRLVVLPYESHGYVAQESTEHVLYEMLSWFDRYVKSALPPTNQPDAASK